MILASRSIAFQLKRLYGKSKEQIVNSEVNSWDSLHALQVSRLSSACQLGEMSKEMDIMTKQEFISSPARNADSQLIFMPNLSPQ